MNNQNSNINEKQRNIDNNAKNIKIAADIASKSANPYAKAAGSAVKIADKLSNGRASAHLGKKLNTANKLVPFGRMAQSASNGIASSGLSNRISSVMSKNKSFSSSKFLNDSLKGSPSTTDDIDNYPIDEGNQDEKPVEESGTFEIKLKHIKIALIAFTPILAGLVIVCLLMSSSLVKLDLLGIGSADKSVELSDDEIQEAFDKNTDESNLTLNFSKESNLKQSNLVQIALTRPKNEAKLEDIEDYYPIIETYKDQYDEDMLYNFFYKIHLLATTYSSKYGVNVDVPLLMSTLMLQAEDRDMNIVFNSNLSSEDNFSGEKSEKNTERFNYDYDWSNYSTSKYSSEHDMEVLAQNMFSKQVKETCVNSSGETTQENILKDDEVENKTLTCEEGEEYKTENLGMKKDDEKYKEFLKTFLYEKYFVNVDDYNVSGSGTLSFRNSYSNGTATANSIYEVSGEPDPSLAINYWSYIDSSGFVYPKDDATGKSLGAWPKNYKKIPTQLNNPKTYSKNFVWPVTPTGGTYSYVYEHNGIDIMADFGTPVYSPVDAILVYSEWGHTVNRGSDETAYSVTLTLEKPATYAGVTFDTIFMTHMSGIVYRCEWGKCNRKVKKGELLGFIGTAAGNATSPGWAPHIHMTFYPKSNYDGGLRTSNIEKLYKITPGTKRKAGA